MDPDAPQGPTPSSGRIIISHNFKHPSCGLKQGETQFVVIPTHAQGFKGGQFEQL